MVRKALSVCFGLLGIGGLILVTLGNPIALLVPAALCIGLAVWSWLWKGKKEKKAVEEEAKQVETKPTQTPADTGTFKVGDAAKDKGEALPKADGPEKRIQPLVEEAAPVAVLTELKVPPREEAECSFRLAGVNSGADAAERQATLARIQRSPATLKKREPEDGSLAIEVWAQEKLVGFVPEKEVQTVLSYVDNPAYEARLKAYGGGRGYGARVFIDKVAQEREQG